MADLNNHISVFNSEYEILTHEGFKDFKGVIRGDNHNKIKLELSNGRNLICTPKHKIYKHDMQIAFAEDLHAGDELYNGIEIKKKTQFTDSNSVYEIIHIQDNHSYLVNDVLCHQCLILDELAFIDPPSIMDDFWRSVWPTISRSKHSKVLIASTPKGTDNLFYQLYDGAIKGENGFASMTIKWDAVPGHDEKWKREQIKQIGSVESFMQEYDCQFLQSGESSIDLSTFDKLRQYCTTPQFFLESDKYMIWKSPLPDRLYAVGVDVAEGVGQNYSVIQILDITDLTSIEQVAVYRDNTIAPAQFTTKLHEIMQQWGNPLVLIERNNCGAQVVDNLRNIHQYENIVSYGAELAGRKKDFLGVVAHTNTKQRGVRNMRYWVNTLNCVRFNHLQTILELKDFVCKPNGTWSARGSGVDDCVMSLIWALVLLDNDPQYGICGNYFEVVDLDENGKPRSIKPLDYGLKYFTSNNKKYDLFGNALEATKYSDAASLPTVFGSSTNQSSEVSDLELEGWTIL